MNKFQKEYLDYYFDGDLSKVKYERDKREYELLGDVKDYIEVTFPSGKKEEFKTMTGFETADMSKGTIDTIKLAGNLYYWIEVRGWTVKSYNKSSEAGDKEAK